MKDTQAIMLNRATKSPVPWPPCEGKDPKSPCIWFPTFHIDEDLGGLTLAGCQVTTRLLCHSPPQQDRAGTK